jgi:hypothetical protein
LQYFTRHGHNLLGGEPSGFEPGHRQLQRQPDVVLRRRFIAGAEQIGLASQRWNFVDSLFFYQPGEHFVPLGLGPPNQQTSKFALEIGLS